MYPIITHFPPVGKEIPTLGVLSSVLRLYRVLAQNFMLLVRP